LGTRGARTKPWPVRIIYSAWRDLMMRAATLMDKNKRLRTPYDVTLLWSDDYMRAQCARTAWSINYYRNAQLAGYTQPTALERDSDDRCYYGYKRDDATGQTVFCNNVRHQRVYCGGPYSDEADCDDYRHYAPLHTREVLAAYYATERLWETNH
jgi:hypothetical protein